MFKHIFPIAIASILVFAACNEADNVTPVDKPDEEVTLTTSEDVANIRYLEQEIDLIADEIVDTRDPGDCPEVTLTYPRGKFPNTITIAFGDSCVRRNDHVFSGTIIVEISAPRHEEGATRVLTFDGFAVDGILHNGTRTTTNTGVDENGNITISKEVDMQLEFPGGQLTTWQASYIHEQTQGGMTPAKYDDAFIITGSGSGINRLGHDFTMEITEPLVHHMACRWLISGIISTETVVEGESYSRSINFGYPAGECDNLALVTLADGTEKEIRIRRRWW